jgi:acyl carrier protein
MLNSEQVKDQIRQFIIEATFAPAEQVKNETLIFVEGIFDSMGFISLINYIEEAFAVKVKDSELLEENFESINAIASYIESKLS